MVDRRSRRRRNLVLLFIMVVVVVVVALAVSYRTERREATEFLSTALDISDEQLDMATSLADLMLSIGDLERPDILLRLETLAEESRLAALRLDEVAVARPVAEASGLFRVAVVSWSQALADLEPAFVMILDAPEGETSGDGMLAEAFETLRVGDVAYEQFVLALDSVDEDISRGDFPAITFAGGVDEDVLFDHETIATRLRLTRKLDERRDVAVTATTEPITIPDPNGVQVLPVAESYTFVAVVTNEGNVAEELIEVSLDISSAEPGLEPIALTEAIPFLEPGEAIAVEFPGIVLPPGLFFDLRLEVSITDDADPEDDIFELPFFTNEAA